MRNHWEYLQYYNEQDVKIMTPAIDYLINLVIKDGINLLSFMSLSSFASAIKYAKCYRDFNINKHYPNKEILTDSRFQLSMTHWEIKVNNYRRQDDRACRDSSNNVTVNDYIKYKNIFENGECYICHANFDYVYYKPTLDRINNKLGHSANNCKPCCEFCNCTKSNHDEHIMRLKIQIRNFAIHHGLPFTLGAGDEEKQLSNR